MKQFDLENLIAKKLNGEITVEENELLDNWLNASEENRKLFHFYKSVWSETETEIKNPDRERIFNKISVAIHFSGHRKTFQTGYRFRLPVYLKVASVVFFVALGWLAWYFIQTKDKPVKQEVVSKVIEKSAAKGQKLKTFLPDGSVAWLNAESKINYTEFFSDTLRVVHLKGMAYFEVEKDSLRPFVVRSGEVDVVALGTAFSVRSYDSENIITVALEEGSLLVKMGGKNHLQNKIILKPGRRIDYNIKEQTYFESGIKPDVDFNWRNGVLHFEDASFDEIITKLSRWYGVNFEVRIHVKEQWHYTGTFKNFYLKDVLKSISYTKDFDFEIQRDKVIIYHKQ